MTLRIVSPGPDRDRLLPLLLLADDSEQQVRSYMHAGDLYTLSDEQDAILGIVLAIPLSGKVVELKSVAVDPDRHNQGIGRRLLAAVLANLADRGVQRVVLGTGNSSIGQIAFYQKAGFRLWKIERDVFTPENGYPAGLEEHGIPLRDMVWFERDLDDLRTSPVNSV